MSRKAFNFYNSHWLQIKLLKDKQKLELYNAICQVQFLEIHIDDIQFKDPISNIVWTGIKHSIQTSLNGFITKQVGLKKEVITPLAKGIENPMQAPYVDPCQQEKGKEKEEEKEEEQYIPSLLFQNILNATWNKWIQYKDSQFKFKYKSIDSEQIALNQLISLSGNKNDIADKIVNHSISNGYKGLFELKTNGQTVSNEQTEYENATTEEKIKLISKGLKN